MGSRKTLLDVLLRYNSDMPLNGKYCGSPFVTIRDAGAYGAVMASNYNRRPLPVEVLVDEGQWRIIRRRQTVDDMLVLES